MPSPAGTRVPNPRAETASGLYNDLDGACTPQPVVGGRWAQSLAPLLQPIIEALRSVFNFGTWMPAIVDEVFVLVRCRIIGYCVIIYV